MSRYYVIFRGANVETDVYTVSATSPIRAMLLAISVRKDKIESVEVVEENKHAQLYEWSRTNEQYPVGISKFKNGTNDFKDDYEPNYELKMLAFKFGNII